MNDLVTAVAAVVRDCLGVAAGEDVLVICNPATRELGERLRAEAQGAGADAALATMAERDSHAGEPPRPVAAAMADADVVLAPTVQSLSHTAARKAASEAGARITCPNGSDLRLGLEERTAIPDAGELTERGAFGNLPCGEGFIAPVEGSCEGRLVVDGTIAGVGIPEQPVTLTVEGGRLAAASGDAGERLMALLTEHGPEAATVAELGIGSNEKAILSGNVLEDEKILGTAHVAFGASAAIGGTVQVPVHLDCVVMKPDVALDGEPIVRGGELLV